MEKRLTGIILAAGLGTRMKSQTVKVLHKVCGKHMLEYVVGTAERLCDQVIVVVGHQADEVKAALGDRVQYVLQNPQLGTGHALMQARQALPLFEGPVLVLCGDTPLIGPEHLKPLIDAHYACSASATVLVTNLNDPKGYGRIIRDRGGRISGIVEHRDASAEELKITEVNTGIYCFDPERVFEALEGVNTNNAQGEYYLTDAIRVLIKQGERVETVLCPDPAIVLGVNDRHDLARAEMVLRDRVRDYHLQNGVTLIQPSSIFIDEGVEIGKDTIIQPFVFLQGKTTIGARCTIGQGSTISDSVLEDDVKITYSVVESSRICAGASVGPFSHIRPNSVIGPRAKIGNYAEVKNSVVGEGSKIQHHSYIGDTKMGKNVNIGAGTVTVNYDGVSKHETHVADDAFIGCNSNLIAPVILGEESFIAAGSTISKDVPKGALGIARSPQRNLEGWVQKRKERLQRGGNTGEREKNRGSG